MRSSEPRGSMRGSHRAFATSKITPPRHPAVPDPIVQATVSEVIYLQQLTRLTGIYTSESIGDYSYTLNTTLNSTMTPPTHVADSCQLCSGRWAVMSIESLIDDAYQFATITAERPDDQVPGQDPTGVTHRLRTPTASRLRRVFRV